MSKFLYQEKLAFRMVWNVEIPLPRKACFLQVLNAKIFFAAKHNNSHMKYNRFLPLFVPLITFVLSELFFVKTKLIYLMLVFVFLLFLFTVRQFVKASKRKEDWWNFLILPSMFYFGSIVLSLMIPNKAIIQMIFILNAIFLYFYFVIIYGYLINSEVYQLNSMENVASYGNFLAFYFLASSIYGLQSFLHITIWKLMLVFIVGSVLIVYQVIWANKINNRIGYFYLLILSLILIELAWSVSFLSLNYYTLGLIMAVCYYVLIGLVRFFLLNKLNKKIIKMYLLFGFSSIIIVLITARWL
jgi:hypothetical protein